LKGKRHAFDGLSPAGQLVCRRLVWTAREPIVPLVSPVGIAYEGSREMLDDSHHDLLAKYESIEPEFDPNELATIFEILNLEPRSFTRAELHEYKLLISRTLDAQRMVMREMTGKYKNLDDQGLRIEAMQYVVQNITKITSAFMLDFLVCALRHRPASPLQRGRANRSEA
jgi:hypothetical protein